MSKLQVKVGKSHISWKETMLKLKGVVMQIEKAVINNHLCVSNIS